MFAICAMSYCSKRDFPMGSIKLYCTVKQLFCILFYANPVILSFTTNATQLPFHLISDERNDWE